MTPTKTLWCTEGASQKKIATSGWPCSTWPSTRPRRMLRPASCMAHVATCKHATCMMATEQTSIPTPTALPSLTPTRFLGSIHTCAHVYQCGCVLGSAHACLCLCMCHADICTWVVVVVGGWHRHICMHKEVFAEPCLNVCTRALM